MIDDFHTIRQQRIVKNVVNGLFFVTYIRAAIVMNTAFCFLFLLVWAPNAMAGCIKPVFVYNTDDTNVMPTEKADVIWLQKVFVDAACTLKVKPSPSASTARRLQELAQGKSDILMNGSRLPEREAIVYFSKPYAEEVVGLLVRKGERERWNGLTLDAVVAHGGKVIGGQSGWYGSEFQRFRQQQNRGAGFVAFRHSVLEGVKSLVSGRGDALVASQRMVQDLPQDLREQTEILSSVLDRGPVHVMFSRATVGAADLAHLNASIERLLRRGIVPVVTDQEANKMALPLTKP